MAGAISATVASGGERLAVDHPGVTAARRILGQRSGAYRRYFTPDRDTIGSGLSSNVGWAMAALL
jgi:hypothetical protein